MSFILTSALLFIYLSKFGALASPSSTLGPPSVIINASGTSILAPPSFLGFSQENLTMAAPILPTPEYQGLVKLLSSFNTGPFVIRWGGNGQDTQDSPLTDDNWKAMRDLHTATGVRYMVGLNLAVSE